MNDLPVPAFSSHNAVINAAMKRRFNLLKVEKAAKFLSLPEIEQIASDETKTAFLKSKGMNEDEISEAFQHRERLQCISHELDAPQLCLNAVANEENVLAVYGNQKRNTFTAFFSFCRKFVLLAGITTACYYFYQRWRRVQAEKKKTERAIKDELNQIKNEVRRIANELRQQDSVKQNQSALLAEINSLKEILVGRKHFEEIQTEKVTIPSWQLNQETNSSSATIVKAEGEKTKVKPPSWQMNGSRWGDENDLQIFTEATPPKESTVETELARQPLETAAQSEKTNIPVAVSVLSEDGDPIVTCANVNGTEHEENQKPSADVATKVQKHESTEKVIKGKKSEKKNQAC